MGLSAEDLFDHSCEFTDTANSEHSAMLLDQAGVGEVVELPRHRFAVGADTTCYFGVGRCWREYGAVPVADMIACQTQEFGVDAVSHRQCAEFEDPLREISDLLRQASQDHGRDDRVRSQHLP